MARLSSSISARAKPHLTTLCCGFTGLPIAAKVHAGDASTLDVVEELLSEKDFPPGSHVEIDRTQLDVHCTTAAASMRGRQE